MINQLMVRLSFAQCACAAFLCLILLPVFAGSEFKIITLQHRFAEEILPAIKPLVGENGTATAMKNNLIIRANAKEMAEIEEIISRLDTPSQNLKITIRRDSLNHSNRDNISINGRQHLGEVEFATGKSNRGNADSASIAIQQQQDRRATNLQQFVQVQDGSEAFIRVGQRIPYTQQWLALAQQYSRIQTSTQFIDIDTGFNVRPRAIGNQIELSITPRFSQRNQAGVIDFTSLTTIIRVYRGEWLDIGGVMQKNDDVSRAILSWQTENARKNDQLFILVE